MQSFEIVKTSEFIDALRTAGNRKLFFLNEAGDAALPGYHLTEIKAASYDTVDCGGQTNRWKETIFQLWVPTEADGEYMAAGKFARIFDKVSSSIDVDLAAGVRVEYGDNNFFPSVYSVESITENGDTLRVLLAPPASACKARDRHPAEPCCS